MKSNVKFNKILMLAVATVLLCSGCASSQVDPAANIANQNTITVIGPKEAVTPSALQQRASAKAFLQRHQIQVVVLGETANLIIPSDSLFELTSANYDQGAQLILKNVAQYIRSYKTVSVTVKAYTDNLQKNQIAKALTILQAQNIVKTLWLTNLDTRLISAQGYGSANAVASNNSQQGMYDNRRVEIDFRFLSKSNQLV